MKTTGATKGNNVEKQPLKSFVEKAYLDYSMAVILDRALPHISDGLKPVQRRIIYAMSELGLKNTTKFKKSARTVGDVLGKYHPHGDLACYEAMVLMAQPFTYRYPLVDGQGNWGSIDDPKSFAAMRYTESRLTRYAELLLQELTQGTVAWVPNFDGTLDEPQLLPARVPNLLLNGTTGIAVGMATDIPPHNLSEVVAACVRLLDTPAATLEEICQDIQGPDFPTGGEIVTPAETIRELYRVGSGSIKVRAVYKEERGEIVITALPYQVSGAKVQEQIVAQMQAKKLPMIVDVRDESDHENPVRIILVLRSNRVTVEPLMAHLFATTSLESSYRINLNVVGIDGRPQVKGLRELLKEWLEFRSITVKRRSQYQLDKIEARLHVLQGLLSAYLNLDEVIRIIREEDEPKKVLMAQFKLTMVQAEAILEIKLRQLAKLEEIKIREEQQELTVEQKRLTQILQSPRRLKNLLKAELQQDAAQYGDPRRSRLVVRSEAKVLLPTEVVPAEPVTVILSQQGWIRVAKGQEIEPTTLSYKAGDGFKQVVRGYTTQPVVFLDSTGRTYSCLAHKLPSARGHGEPLTSRFNAPSGATFVGMLMEKPEQYILLASDAGYGFIVKMGELYSKNRSGKVTLTLPRGSHPLVPQVITAIDTQYLVALTRSGHLLLFPLAYLPLLSKGKGNKIINIPSAQVAQREDYLVALVLLGEGDKLVLTAGKRNFTFKFAELAKYQGERGRRGNKLPQEIRRCTTVKVVAATK